MSMAVNKVVYDDNTLIDLTSDTVTAEKMLSGTTAHDKSGVAITGNIATKTASDMTASGATVTAPAGYYASAARKSVRTATQATPSITVSDAGMITASATQSAGYVSAGTKSATKQLTTQAAQTITPGTADQTIAAGKYLTGAQTIKGDANLVAENIKSGVSIFGVEGTAEGGGGTSDNVITITNNTGYVVVIGAVNIANGETKQINYSSVQPVAGFNLTYMYLWLMSFSGTFASDIEIGEKHMIDGSASTTTSSFGTPLFVNSYGNGALFDASSMFQTSDAGPVSYEFELLVTS